MLADPDAYQPQSMVRPDSTLLFLPEVHDLIADHSGLLIGPLERRCSLIL